MTHHEIRTLPDGTRRYSKGQRYKPVAPEDRKKGVRKPDHPEAVRFHGQWFLPLQTLPDAARVMPETVPDELAYEHMERTFLCRCRACRRPEAEKWRSKYRRQVLGLKR